MRFYSTSEIKRILAAFDPSKMHVTHFCREKGISQASFYRWKNQQTPRPPAIKPAQAEFVEINPPVALNHAPRYRLCFSGGVSLELFPGFDRAEVASLIQAIVSYGKKANFGLC
jgi:hypothetical protein